jgi:hypothetical protein
MEGVIEHTWKNCLQPGKEARLSTIRHSFQGNRPVDELLSGNGSRLLKSQQSRGAWKRGGELIKHPG